MVHFLCPLDPVDKPTRRDSFESPWLIDDTADAMIFAIKNAAMTRRFDRKACRCDQIASFSTDRRENQRRRSNGRIVLLPLETSLEPGNVWPIIRHP
jgi:hypothetical protein